MKRNFLKTMILVLCFALFSSTYAFAYAPGNGVYEPGSTEFYDAGRGLTQSNSTPVITSEFAALIAEKEATLYTEDGNLRGTLDYPSSYRVSPMYQYPQENSYYCGPAAVKSVLYAEGVVVSQSTLAGNNYLQTDRFSGTPWYLTNGSSREDYPVYNTLHAFCDYPYFPYPYGALGTPPTSTLLSLRIRATTSQGHGVVANGESKASSSHASHMPGYTTGSNIAHWIAVDGYMDNGNTIWIIDPIRGCSSISWNGNVAAYYTVSLEKFTAFVAPRGIFW